MDYSSQVATTVHSQNTVLEADVDDDKDLKTPYIRTDAAAAADDDDRQIYKLIDIYIWEIVITATGGP